MMRPMVEADFPSVVKLATALGYPIALQELAENFRILKNLSDHAIFVAEDPERGIVGWMNIREDRSLVSESTVEIVALVVDDQIQRKGIGRQLVYEAEKWGMTRGLGKCLVRSRVARTGAHGFYVALGYHQEKTQHVFSKKLG